DTPGVITPNYSLQESMMNFVQGSLIDADVILFVTDIHEKFDESDVVEKLRKTSSPIAVLINKIDKYSEEEVRSKIEFWQEKLNPDAIFAISAMLKHGVTGIMEYIKEKLPIHPPYYEKDELTDKSMRFFVSEMIREKIFKLYDKEIPYSTEIVVTSYKEEDTITRRSEERRVGKEG